MLTGCRNISAYAREDTPTLFPPAFFASLAISIGTWFLPDAENIKIVGRGILDNSKNTEEVLFEVNAEGNTEAVNNVKRRHTIQLEYCKDILPRFDTDLAKRLKQSLGKRGIEINTQAQVTSIEKLDSEYRITYLRKGKEETV